MIVVGLAEVAENKIDSAAAVEPARVKRSKWTGRQAPRQTAVMVSAYALAASLSFPCEATETSAGESASVITSYDASATSASQAPQLVEPADEDLWRAVVNELERAGLDAENVLEAASQNLRAWQRLAQAPNPRLAPDDLFSEEISEIDSTS
jgi:hypothetical protein